MFIIYFILWSIITIYEYLLSYFKCELYVQNNVINKIVKYNNINLKIINNYNNLLKYKKILIISNHLTYLDCLFIFKFIKLNFTNYNIHVVSNENIKCIPIIGKYLNKFHILINKKDKNNNIDNIKLKIEYINSLNSNNIILLFPEGHLFTINNKIKSDEYSKKNNNNIYKNLLSPRYKAFDIISSFYKPDIILDLTLFSPDNINKYKGTNLFNLFFFNEYPKYMELYVNNVSKNDILKYINNDLLDNIWYNKDILIEEKKNKIMDKINILNDIQNNYNYYKDILEQDFFYNYYPKKYILYLGSSFLISTLYIRNYIFGKSYAILSLLLFITSYNTYVINKYKYFNIFINIIYYIVSIIIYKTLLAKIYMIILILLYVFKIFLIIFFFEPNDNIIIFIQLIIYIHSYLLIYVELLHKKLMNKTFSKIIELIL